NMKRLFQKLKFEVIPAIIKKGQRLFNALKSIGHDNIPSNVILDKTLTGIGATYQELHAKRHSIIIEPTLPVIHDKAYGKDEILPVYENCKVPDVKRYLQRAEVKYKKVLTTPESFWKIKNACEELKWNMYNTFFCLFDECERLTEDSDFRRKITMPMKDFFQFKGNAFVSATPLEVSDPRFEGFQRIKITPDFDYKKPLNLIVTNSYDYSVRQLLLEHLVNSSRVFIFLNTTNGIEKIVNSLGIEGQSKIFCSEKSVKKLKKKGYTNVASLYSEPIAKYNFLTCRFYSALDIILKVKPDIVMLTNLYEAEHSMIDPYTEAVQICGRFRKEIDGSTFNSITHLTNVRNTLKVKTDEEIDIELEEKLKTYEGLQARYNETTDATRKKAIIDDINRLGLAEFATKLDDGLLEIDHFAIDNYYNNERVKRYYLSGNALREAYEGTNHFTVNYRNVFLAVGDSDRLELKELPTFMERCKLMVDKLNKLQDDPDRDFYINILKQEKDGELIIEAYEKLGVEVLANKKYQRADIKKELDKYNTELLRFSSMVVQEVKEAFPLNVSMPQEDIKNQLQDIYKRYGIDYKVRKNTIEDYYDASPSYHKKPYTYTLKAIKKFPTN
ncbi:hypothetical protein, partial [Butyricimonas paravirosa]